MPESIQKLVQEIKELAKGTDEIYDWQDEDWSVINNILVDEKLRLLKLRKELGI